MHLLFIPTLVLLAIFSSCTKEEPLPNDEKNLLGTWQLVMIERRAGTTVTQEFNFEDSIYTLVFNQDSTLSLSQFNGLGFPHLSPFHGKYTIEASENNPDISALNFVIQTKADSNSVNPYFPLGNIMILRKESLTLQNITLGQPSITINHTFRKE